MKRCRNCKSERVASYDNYDATCAGEVDDSGEFHPGGYTEVAWDSCSQLGWQCPGCFATELASDHGDDLEVALKALVR